MKTQITESTKIRILSGIILIMLVMLVFSLGKKAIMLSFFFLALIVFDEIIKYFFKYTREEYAYWLFMTIFVFLSVFLYQIKSLNFVFWSNTIIILTMIFQIMLVLGMLFKVTWEKDYIFLNPFFWCVNLSFIFLSFVVLLNQVEWFESLIFFTLISAVTDSMAWVVGKKFGKRKLYPEVSPNKTIEGAFGGWFFAGILIVSYLCFKNTQLLNNLQILLCGLFLPVLAICGDLVQSYFKRMVHLKDSSKRIPGHGGFYDRLDSHLFLIPFFVFFTKMIQA